MNELSREAFFTQHPLCCYCGAQAPAVTKDHMPSRSLFVNRQWPEGFEFPACALCNEATRLDEEIVAVLARAYPDSTTPEAQREFEGVCRSIARRRPEILEAFTPSAREVRTMLRRRGLKIPPGQTTRDIPLLSVSDPRIDAAVRNFGRKLNLALFYFHTGQIVPLGGGVAVTWRSNIQIYEGALPAELAEVLPGFPTLRRNRQDLGDQFFYRHGVIDTRRAAAFLSMFRESFAVIGFVHVDASRLPAIAQTDVLGPYVHGQVPV